MKIVTHKWKTNLKNGGKMTRTSNKFKNLHQIWHIYEIRKLRVGTPARKNAISINSNEWRSRWEQNENQNEVCCVHDTFPQSNLFFNNIELNWIKEWLLPFMLVSSFMKTTIQCIWQTYIYFLDRRPILTKSLTAGLGLFLFLCLCLC